MGEPSSPLVDSPVMNSPDDAETMGSTASNGGTVARSASKSSTTTQNGSSASSFPAPKSDKPRPHVCATCTRSFARLEHLKRHERSHTKEKPFECPECSRCFARRDLLLRHQQKLHSTTTPSSRPRSGRRESAAGVNTGRVRKNSVANNNASTMRPRANTLSHVDAGTLGMLATSSSNSGRNFPVGHGHHTSLSGVTGFEYRGMSSGHRGIPHGLPKLDTSNLSDLSGGLRTAPAYGGFGAELGMNALAFGHGNGNTINPNAIHLNGLHGLGIDGPSSPFHQGFPGISASQAMNEDENTFDWMAQGFENQMSFAQPNESAIETSSPSAMSTNSPSGISEVMMDGGGTMLHNMPAANGSMWTNSMVTQAQMMASPHILEFSQSTFNEMLPAPPGTISPKSLLAQNNGGFDMGFPTPPSLSAMDPPSMIPGYGAPSFQLPLVRNGGSSASTSSVDSSLRQSSITTASSDVINEQIRGALIAGLKQNSGFGQRKFSQPAISSPLSPGFGSRSKSFSVTSFPSTQDLQRYLSAYVRYFHPHLPFLHVSSLSFESPEYTTPLRTLNGHQPQLGQSSLSGGGGCLILAITAIGALYEHEMAISKELFESAKKLISNYLEERRKANLSKAQFAQVHPSEAEDTPLWLVQAMLLNVIYGYNCGDKAAADAANTHCAALVSLARGAELARPYPGYMVINGMGHGVAHHDMHMVGMGADGWNSIITEPDDSDWHEWIVMEERKRTLYTVFVVSSLLVSAYNHAPAMTNSEIRLDLPCDEELWSAENAQAWRAMGGATLAESRSVTFGAALGHLLTAAQRQRHQRHSSLSNRAFASGKKMEDLPESDLKPSAFGCLILVNALHNYIWETRQRHLGRQWTIQETEQMHAHIEPALRAWQAAWASNPNHSLERPNPFGIGPLSADSIPLLDLAYVRLFVNLGPSKEAFWQRNFLAMAEELAKGADILPALDSPSSGSENSHSCDGSQGSISRPESIDEAGSPDLDLRKVASQDQAASMAESGVMAKIGQPSRRELYLRKAAFYAADSLSMSDKLGLSFAEHTCRELPLQSAMCAFDCAQVLAEWVTAVQERVGPYLGVMGRDEVDYDQAPGNMLLEDEDLKLVEKIDEVLCHARQKLGNGSVGFTAPDEGGYGSRILLTTAQMLERAAVWPVTRLMARSLETQAAHMKDRAHGSVVKGG